MLKENTKPTLVGVYAAQLKLLFLSAVLLVPTGSSCCTNSTSTTLAQSQKINDKDGS
jgi:hypothetical protein